MGGGATGTTSAPTAYIEPFLVSETQVAQAGGNNYFDGGLSVTNSIGGKITDDPVVKLFNTDCLTEASAGEVLSIPSSDEVFTPGSVGSPGSFTYKIEVDQSLMGNTDSTYLTCTPGAGSACAMGNLKFCTRVSSFVGSIEVAFRETNFDLAFNLTENGFDLIPVTIEENVPDSFVTLVDTDFTVDACQCNPTTYDCETSAVQQDTNLIMCLRPFHNGAENDEAKNVKITNFNIKISPSDGSTDVTFDPVTFGSDSWVVNTLATVEPDDDDYVIKVTSPIIAQFYIQNIATVDASGNAFLEFTSQNKNGAPVFADFGVEVELGGVEGIEYGCFQALVQRIRQIM